MNALVYETRTDREGRSHVYVELTPQAEREYDRRMHEQGLVKKPIELAAGRRGYTWERFRDPTPEERAKADQGCVRPQSASSTGMPGAAKLAKPTARTDAGDVLDDRFAWAPVLDRVGDQRRVAKAGPAGRRPASPGSTGPDSPPAIPDAVLRAQERDAECRPSRAPRNDRAHTPDTPAAGSGPRRGASPDAEGWPWRDEDLYAPTESLPTVNDALSEDFEF